MEMKIILNYWVFQEDYPFIPMARRNEKHLDLKNPLGVDDFTKLQNNTN